MKNEAQITTEDKELGLKVIPTSFSVMTNSPALTEAVATTEFGRKPMQALNEK